MFTLALFGDKPANSLQTDQSEDVIVYVSTGKPDEDTLKRKSCVVWFLTCKTGR
jgi:hypothetical protein